MLHRMVSRSAGVLGYAALALVVASCEDNTTGTPLTPPPPSTAVYVNPVEPDGGYTIEQRNVTLPDGTDLGLQWVVTPDPVFEVVYPDGSFAEGQTINFQLNLPGILASTSGTVDADGLVSPGTWVVFAECPVPVPPYPENKYCRPVQRVIASPASGNSGVIDVQAIIDPSIPDIRVAHR